MCDAIVQCSDINVVVDCVSVFCCLMKRRPPRSTRTDTSFPTRRASDLIVGAEGVVAAPVGLHTVGMFEILKPHPVFFHYRIVDQLAVTIVRCRYASKYGIGQPGGKLPVSGIVELATVNGQWIVAAGIQFAERSVR